MELSIPQLEYLLEGCSQNNQDVQNDADNKKVYEGADAIQFLIDSGEIK
jgi:hypothetical protein